MIRVSISRTQARRLSVTAAWALTAVTTTPAHARQAARWTPFLGEWTGVATRRPDAGLPVTVRLTVRPDGLSLAPRVPSHWSWFRIKLNLRGHTITIYWQRGKGEALPVKPHLVAAWGEWIALDSLPAEAVCLVRGALGDMPAAAPEAVVQPAAILTQRPGH